MYYLFYDFVRIANNSQVTGLPIVLTNKNNNYKDCDSL